MIYLITYNINTMVRDYAPLYDAIKQIGYSYKHPQESTWFVATDKKLNASGMTEYLRRFLTNTDTIFIAELTSKTMVEGWLTNNFWDWYKRNIE